ncbi:MAG: abortive infection family protein [Candidatus Margulisiibacteriota bacterium]
MAAATNDPVFVMHGARSAVAGGMLHIEEQVKALELAVVENAGLAFDLAKTLVESACKTIITERGGTFDKDDDLPKLFKVVKQSVPFLPITVSGEAGARRSLEQTLNGLSTALQGVCELRNAFGFASHGSDSPRPIMESIQALLVAQAADAIIGFLYRVHRQDLSPPKNVPLEYSDHSDFNEWIDEQNEPVIILNLPPYRPSEVLFSVDREAYRDKFTDYTTEVEMAEEESEVSE